MARSKSRYAAFNYFTAIFPITLVNKYRYSGRYCQVPVLLISTATVKVLTDNNRITYNNPIA
jgi:hypothetical protein